MKASKKTICLLQTAAMVISLCAWGGEAAAAETITNDSGIDLSFMESEKAPEEYVGKISFWSFSDMWGQIIEPFNEVYPNIEVENVVIGQGDYLGKIQTTLAGGGELGDIILAELNIREQLFEMGIFDNLEGEPYNLNRDYLEDFLIPQETYEGNVAGICNAIGVGAMAYKWELLDKYLGISTQEEVEDTFKTWEDFIEAGKKVYEESNGGVYLIASYSMVQQLMTAEGTEPYFDGNTPSNYFLNERAEERYNIVKAFTDNHVMDPAIPAYMSPGLNQSMTEDHHIFYAFPTSFSKRMFKMFDPEGYGRWRVAKAPGQVSTIGGTLVGINKDSKDKECAWEFYKYMMLSQEGTVFSFNTGGGVAPIKGMEDVIDYKAIQDDYIDQNEIYYTMYVEWPKESVSRPPELYLAEAAAAYEAVDMALMADTSMTLDEYKALLKNEIYARCPDLE